MSIVGKLTKKAAFFKGHYGQIFHGDSLEYMRSLDDDSINLIVTSPPIWSFERKRIRQRKG